MGVYTTVLGHGAGYIEILSVLLPKLVTFLQLLTPEQ